LGVAQNAVLVILTLGQYGLFAPLYWFWMIRKAKGKPICYIRREFIAIEDYA
jgi:hypothetical protein